MHEAAATWCIAQQLTNDVKQIATDARVPALVARVLINRGLRDSAEIDRFLRPSSAHLHSPFAFRHMERAVNRIQGALARSEKILVQGDYDVDGSASAALLLNCLRHLGADAQASIPIRALDGYGLNERVVREAAEAGVKLLITCDNGTTAVREIALANELGIDTIITDHHTVPPELPKAFAVLNPHVSDEKLPFKDLCGAGVAFKLVQALMTSLAWEPARVRALTESFLKMVAIATVADVVPLTGENRIIVHHGLNGMTRVRNAGLRALLEVAGFKEGDEPTAGQIAFRIAPRINAAGRMADASQVIEMFLTADATTALTIAQQLHEWNAERQQTEADTLAACLEATVQPEQRALVFAGDGWHKGVVGIVASRLVERYCRPVFVLGIDNEKGEASGSGRSIEAFHLLDALESMGELFTKFGGHSHAAGLTLPAGRIEEFRARLDAYAQSRLAEDDLRPRLKVDATADFAELNEDSVAQLLKLGPFGQGNAAPILMARNASFPFPPTLMKEKHLRMKVAQSGKQLTMKAWNFAERKHEFTSDRVYDLAFTVEEDPYSAARGYAPWSATLRDLR